LSEVFLASHEPVPAKTKAVRVWSMDLDPCLATTRMDVTDGDHLVPGIVQLPWLPAELLPGLSVALEEVADRGLPTKSVRVDVAFVGLPLRIGIEDGEEGVHGSLEALGIGPVEPDFRVELRTIPTFSCDIAHAVCRPGLRAARATASMS
jgi:hypothetical protein